MRKKVTMETRLEQTRGHAFVFLTTLNFRKWDVTKTCLRYGGLKYTLVGLLQKNILVVWFVTTVDELMISIAHRIHLERYFLLDVNEGITSAAKLRTYWTGVMFNFTLKWHVMLSLSVLSRLDDLRHAHQSNFSQQLTRFICWGFLNERHGCIFIKNLPTGLKLCKRSPDYLTCGP